MAIDFLKKHMEHKPAPSNPLSRSRERAGVRARTLRAAQTDAERALWHALRNRGLCGYKFRRQHPIDCYIADFACLEAGLVVELDGGQHFEPPALLADEQRTAALRRAGFEVLRFTNREALTERDAVLARLLDWLQIHHPHPCPLPLAGEGVPPSKDRA
ncbi:endonuclease domain-containing protein [Methylibium sp.]|uniref:endonuclease domain-containing protein n=1 Tax=Methylibium sp. TaxID=2067992 RepID=UPI003D10165B